MELHPRYIRNLGAITAMEQEKLRSCRVCLAGCGGLGGFLAEALGRLGIGHITAVDSDCFDLTNLNRQLLAREDNLGMSKAEAVKLRLAQVNPDVHVDALQLLLTAENAVQVIAGHDLVLDGLDNIPSRRLLQQVCKELGIPLIHGAVEGWFGQVATIVPGDDTLSRLYPEGSYPSKSSPAVLPFVPAFVAAVQAAEAVKLLLGREPALRDQILFIDLLSNSFDILPL